jgi:hypothetical protein
VVTLLRMVMTAAATRTRHYPVITLARTLLACFCLKQLMCTTTHGHAECALEHPIECKAGCVHAAGGGHDGGCNTHQRMDMDKLMCC